MTDQTSFTSEELLENHAYDEPLIAGGVSCHGGFDADGNYLSPRMKNRGPAIEAWQASHLESFGTEIMDVAIDSFPDHYPNVAQAKFLIGEGVTEPMIVALTRIGTVEGFGAGIRYSAIPDIQRHFDEDLTGTATAHLGGGLYEAHARDEAGFEAEAGHRQMWFAARDIAFENAPSPDVLEDMLKAMGISGGPGAGAPSAKRIAEYRKRMQANRQMPDDIPWMLEGQLMQMIRLLFIEISAFHGFRWAAAVLSDSELVAGDGEAARVVDYIRQDEAPHVEYLKTSLTEMRDRTFIGESGTKYPGTDIINPAWERALKVSRGTNRQANQQAQLGTVERALEKLPQRKRILEEFHELGSVRPDSSGAWVSN